MRTEISQAKRETDYFRANVERSKRLNPERLEDVTDSSLSIAKKSRKTGTPLQTNPTTKRVYEFRQKETDETIKKRKRLEQAQKKLSQPAEEVKSSKQEIHSDKNKKSVKETKNKKANFPIKTLKTDKRKGKTKNKSKGASLSNEIAENKSGNPIKASKLKTRHGNNTEKTDRTEFLRNVFL